MKTAELKQEDLANFTGTTCYYKHNILNRTLYLTDGTHHVRQAGNGARWLFDLILLAQEKLKKEQEFQVWDLRKQDDGGWMLKCTDGNSTVLYKQQIPFSDFPLSHISFFLVGEVCMLKSEY